VYFLKIKRDLVAPAFGGKSTYRSVLFKFILSAKDCEVERNKYKISYQMMQRKLIIEVFRQPGTDDD
jgi:hypothetical protein